MHISTHVPIHTPLIWLRLATFATKLCFVFTPVKETSSLSSSSRSSDLTTEDFGSWPALALGLGLSANAKAALWFTRVPHHLACRTGKVTQWLLTSAGVGPLHAALKGRHCANSNLSVKSGSCGKKGHWICISPLSQALRTLSGQPSRGGGRNRCLSLSLPSNLFQ